MWKKAIITLAQPLITFYGTNVECVLWHFGPYLTDTSLPSAVTVTGHRYPGFYPNESAIREGNSMHASDCVHKSNLSFADELFAGSRFVWVKYIFQTQIKSEKKHKNVQKSDYVNGWMRQVVYTRTSPFTIKIKKSKHAEIYIWVYGCALHLYLCSCCTVSPLGGGKPLFKLPDLTQQRGLMTKIE